MPTALSTYAFINAKVRTRMSLLLDEEQFDRFERAENSEAFLDMLQGTTYEEVSRVYAQSGDMNLCEPVIYAIDYGVYEEVLAHMVGPSRSAVEALSLRFQIENVKAVLRLWFERNVRKIPNQGKTAYLPDAPWPRGTTGKELAEIDASEALFDAIQASFGNGCLLPGTEVVLEEGSLFQAELSLDRFYFAELSHAISALPDRDRKVAERMIGLMADIENIRRIARLNLFYKLPAEVIRRSLIEIPSSRIDSTAVGSNLEDIFALRFPEIAALGTGSRRSILSRMDLVEAALEAAMETEAKRALAGYPFSVGIILAYFVLKDREVHRIMNILNEKRYTLPKKESSR